MAAEPAKPKSELTSWDEIATYLGVSRRTAQDREKQHGLPVHRLPGDKARVWAYPAELDAWKVGTITKACGVAAQGIDRRRWLRYGLAVGAGTLGTTGLALFASKLPWGKKLRPSAYRVEGATLIVLGSDSRELWRYTFPKQMPEDWYKEVTYRLCHFADLEGTGHMETLFYYASSDFVSEQALVCFNSEGRIRWKFVPGREVTDNRGHTFAPPYGIRAFAEVRSSDSKRAQIVVSSLHNWSFPNQIALLDGKTGSLISEYWHRGHLTELAVADLDHDGHPQLLLGGVNDAEEYKCATLVVFDHRRVSGSTRDPHGAPYFKGISPGTEKWTVFFPKTPISKYEEFNRVQSILVTTDNRIRVVVGEGPRPQNLAVVYELDYGLRPINAVLSVDLVGRFLEMQGTGKLPKESAYVTAEHLMRQVRVIKGDA